MRSFALGNLVWWLGRPVEGGTLVFWIGQAPIGLALWIAGELTATRVFAWPGWAQEDPIARILLLTVLWCSAIAVLAPSYLLLLAWHGIVAFDLAELRGLLALLLGAVVTFPGPQIIFAGTTMSSNSSAGEVAELQGRLAQRVVPSRCAFWAISAAL